MFSSENVKSITVTIQADPTTDGVLFPVLKAPRALTVVSAYAVSRQTQNAGTAILATLVNYGSAGTANAGTVASALGGTAAGARLTANTPAAATVSGTLDYVASGDWLYLQYNEQGAGWIAGDCLTYTVNYVIGNAS